MKLHVIPLNIAYMLLLVVMFMLPHYSIESCSMLANTTSHLGAEGVPNAWIMNVTFILLGIGSAIGGWVFYKGYIFHRITVLTFGLSLILVAIFQHAAFIPGKGFPSGSDDLHSIFASITGVSFTLLAISTAFIQREDSDSRLALSIGVVATTLSIAMFMNESLMGLWQRTLFICCFGWMIYAFRKPESLKDPTVETEESDH